MKFSFNYREILRRWYLILPVFAVCVGVLIPLAYLGLRAFQADLPTLLELVFRLKNLKLLKNTVLLTIGVLLLTTLLALPLAWLTSRVDLYGRTLLTVLGVLPLAVPGYVMAYVLMATTGEYGTLAQNVGLVIPRLDGYDGALIALSFTTFPYLFLNLRTALLGMDSRLEETARSLGYGPFQTFFKVVLPQLRPALLAGGMLVGLHVLGDFGVVSLMRYETFSYALYLQYTASYDRIYAAWLALILLTITGAALLLEAYLLKGLMFHSEGKEDAGEDPERLNIGVWSWFGYLYGGSLGFLSVGLPLLTVGHWLMRSSGWIPSGNVFDALVNSVSASLPAAFLATALALPVAYLGVRYRTVWSRTVERIAYLGYATPRLALALAWIVFVLAFIPFAYQSLWVLVLVYSLHFMAEAIGPIRSSVYQLPPSLEEAARSLGGGSLKIFKTVVFPLLRKGMLVSVALVFLSAMKELPITLLLSPPGFDTLATNTWSYAESAMFADAAPFALTIMLFSGCFVGLLLVRE